MDTSGHHANGRDERWRRVARLQPAGVCAQLTGRDHRTLPVVLKAREPTYEEEVRLAAEIGGSSGELIAMDTTSGRA